MGLSAQLDQANTPRRDQLAVSRVGVRRCPRTAPVLTFRVASDRGVAAIGRSRTTATSSGSAIHHGTAGCGAHAHSHDCRQGEAIWKAEP